jgi:hypothetical protein
VPPLSQENRDRSKVPEVRSTARNSDQLGDKSLEIWLGQKGHPRKRIAQKPSQHVDVAGPRETSQQMRGESHDGPVLLKLLDSHQGEIVGVPAAKSERRNNVEPLSRRSGMMQQLTERHVLISNRHDIHSTVELRPEPLLSRRYVILLSVETMRASTPFQLHSGGGACGLRMPAVPPCSARVSAIVARDSGTQDLCADGKSTVTV